MYRLKQLSILLGDIVIFYAALLAAVLLRSRLSPLQEFLVLLPHFTIIFSISIVVMFIAGLYDISQFKHRRLYQRVITAAITTFITGVLYFYLRTTLVIAPKTILAVASILSFVFIALWRKIQGHYLSTTNWQTRVVFAGCNEQIDSLIKFLAERPELGHRVVGVILKNNQTLSPSLSALNIPIVSKIQELSSHQAFPDLIVLSPEVNHDKDLLNDLYAHMAYQFETVELSDFFETVFNRVPPFIFSEGWFLTNLHEHTNKIYDRFRILVDYACAFLICAVFLVTLPVLALAIKLSSPGPIFIRQKRVGRNGALFTIFKYRSMKALAPDGSAELHGAQFTAVNDPRITPLGKILRKFRLDEIPQCLNVILGDMAMIGPRPERPEFVTELTTHISFYPLRHLVKPGFTGWAQVQSSYYGTIDENLLKLEYDLYYVKHRGPLIDLTIILRTVGIVLGMKGR
jgi:exopolysaccharide biosynthesis polyprenyl glycosylphosphotransferase